MSEVDFRCLSPDCANKGTYRLNVSCSNCGWRGVATLTKGHEFDSGRGCPHCGVTYRLSAHDSPDVTPRYTP